MLVPRRSAWMAAVLVLVGLAACSRPILDGELVRLKDDGDPTTVCFDSQDRSDICITSGNAGTLVDLEPGDCAKVTTSGQTWAIDSAELASCEEVAGTTTPTTDLPTSDGSFYVYDGAVGSAGHTSRARSRAQTTTPSTRPTPSA